MMGKSIDYSISKSEFVDGLIELTEFNGPSNGIRIAVGAATNQQSLFCSGVGAVSNAEIERYKEFLLSLEDYDASLAAQESIKYFKSSSLIELDPFSQIELSGAKIERAHLWSDVHAGRTGVRSEYLNVQDEIRQLVLASLHDVELMAALENEFRSAQRSDLFLINKDDSTKAAECYNADGSISYELLKEQNLVTHTSLSVLPLVLSEEQEIAFDVMVRDVARAKLSILRHAGMNIDLQNLLTDGLSPVCREVTISNFSKVTNYMRMRFDTFASIQPGPIVAFELNGNEPQGDVANSRNSRIITEHLSRTLRALGASESEIQYCFQTMITPVNAVGESIIEIYRKNASEFPELPIMPTIGFMAWKNAKTGAPFSKISNIEAQQSGIHFRKLPDLDESVSFDPFDIIGFREIEGKTRAIIPIIKIKIGEEYFEKEVHFIRRLSGSLLSEANTTWQALKNNRPEIYYKFIGLKHDQHNPEGLSIPSWMWMNPLVPSLTDKRLDAIITDARLVSRFKVKENLVNYILEEKLVQTGDDAQGMAEQILESCERYTAKTRILSAHGEIGLFSGDTEFSSSMTKGEIGKIKSNRRQYVLKQNALTGSSGEGVFIGKALNLAEFPAEVFKRISPEEIELILGELKYHGIVLEDGEEITPSTIESLVKSDGENSLKYNELMTNILWAHLIDYSITLGQTVVQNVAAIEKHLVFPIALSVDDDVFSVSAFEANIDLNPQTIGDKKTGMHSRYVRPQQGDSGKGNITGNSLGVGRNVVLPSLVARRVVALYRDLVAREDSSRV